MPRQAPCRADQEMPRTDGGIANLQIQNGLLGVRALLAPNRLGDDRIESGVQQATDQRLGRVIRAGGLLLVTGEFREFESRAIGPDLGK